MQVNIDIKLCFNKAFCTGSAIYFRSLPLFSNIESIFPLLGHPKDVHNLFLSQLAQILLVVKS